MESFNCPLFRLPYSPSPHQISARLKLASSLMPGLSPAHCTLLSCPSPSLGPFPSQCASRNALPMSCVRFTVISATAAFGALKNIFNSKYLSEELKGEVYKALVLPTLLYGCEAWSLREDLFKRLRSFHNRCARSMCRVNLHHTFRHHITTSSLFRRLNLLDIDSYYHNRLLRWAGHVPRMPMSRAPQQLLTSWVAYSRPADRPKMTWSTALENALKRKGISKEFDERFAIAIAKGRPK